MKKPTTTLITNFPEIEKNHFSASSKTVEKGQTDKKHFYGTTANTAKRREKS
jgi:hypothetical protein